MAKYIDVDKVIPTFDKNTWQGDMMISICENAEAEDVAPVVPTFIDSTIPILPIHVS